MAWRHSYLDVVLIPLSLLFPVAYHLWLWHAVRSRPLRTSAGINAAACHLWVFAMAKNSEENALVVVHSLRNVIEDSHDAGGNGGRPPLHGDGLNAQHQLLRPRREGARGHRPRCARRWRDGGEVHGAPRHGRGQHDARVFPGIPNTCVKELSI